MSKPSRKYWIWKHQPGQDAQEADCIELINRALKLNCTLMQQEYGIQEQRSVTTNWNRVQQIKEGDIIFLVGKQAVYAYGEVIKPRLKPDVCLSMKEIIESRNHTHDEATYSSDCFKGVIHFKDNPVFYENLEEEDNWGQRIDVDSWKFFSEKTSITYSRDEINKGGYPESMSDVVEEAALRFIKNLQQNFIKKELRLLFENKNIILHGAPGTGKTFQTKNIATELIFSKPKGHLRE